MAWLVVDLFNKEFICQNKPYKVKEENYKYEDLGEQDFHGRFTLTKVPTGTYTDTWNFLKEINYDGIVELEEGSIRKITGKSLTYKESPIYF